MKIIRELNTKDIKGKVLREQFILNALNIIIAFIFSLALVLYIISICFNLNNFKEYSTNMFFLSFDFYNSFCNFRIITKIYFW